MASSSLLFAATHDYQQFSSQYSTLQIEDTYFLAFMPIARLIEQYGGLGERTLDFGCGTGRSTRFLQSLGLSVVGADISEAMLKQAQHSSGGTYYLLNSEELPFPTASFDLIFQSFVLLEYDSMSRMIDTFDEFNRVLDDEGCIIVVTGSEEYYCRNWLSFQIDNSEKQALEPGCKVKVSIRGTDVVLFDYYWTDHDYRQVFQQSGFEVVETVHPLAKGYEPFDWVSECEFPCWTIYVLKKQPHNGALSRLNRMLCKD